MKKLFILVMCFSVINFFSCKDSDTVTNEVQNESLFGVELDSQIMENTTRIIPIKNGKIYDLAVYDLSFSSVRFFPINLYEDELLTKVWISNESNANQNNKTKLFFDATSISNDKLSEIYGFAELNKDGNENRALSSIEELYIIGDFSGSFTKMNKDEGKFEYEFIYSNDMSSWGQGNGNLAFKFSSANDWDYYTYGGRQIFEMNKDYLSEDVDQNNSITGLIDGNSYKIVVTSVTEDKLIFHVEGELGNPTLQRGLHIRGSNTNWNYDLAEESDDGTFFYEFIFDENMYDTAIARAEETGNERYKNAAYFTIMPVNAYYLGNFADVGEAGELSSNSVLVGDERNTTFTYNEAHNFVFGNLVMGGKYRIVISKPKGSLIEETVYTVKFSEVE